MFGKRKPKPTATEICKYVRHLGVDHPGWLAWYYFDHPDRFPNPVADNLPGIAGWNHSHTFASMPEPACLRGKIDGCQPIPHLMLSIA